MSTVAEIKEAIDRLSSQEYCELMSVLHPFEDDDWDRQMKSDAAAGKFTAMNEAADQEYGAGRTRPIEDIIEGRP
jgi:hypothetical protein